MIVSMMTQSSPHASDIAVVGTGLVGLACALGLAQQGWRVALLGSKPNTSNESVDWDPRIYAFSPATQALLTRLKIWPQLPFERIQPVHEMRVFHGTNSTPSSALYFTAYEACVSELAWIAENRSVAQVLSTGCAYHSNIQWFETKAQQWEQNASGITITLNDNQVVRSSLVVGADGKDSWVRKQAGFTVTKHDYEQRGIVAHFRSSKPHGGTAWQWFRDDGILALLPLPDRRVSMVWSANLPQAEQILQLTPQALADCVGKASNFVLGDLITTMPALGFALSLQDTNSLIAERVVLVGDAAHVIHPLAGQGMNLGMGDVAALLNTLAERESHRAFDDIRLLQRYARQRAIPIGAMRGLTHGLQQLFATQNPAAYWLRKVGMQALGQPLFAAVKKKLIQQAF